MDQLDYEKLRMADEAAHGAGKVTEGSAEDNDFLRVQNKEDDSQRRGSAVL